MSLAALLLAVFNVLGCLALLTVGGRPERWAVGIIIAFLALTPLIDHLGSGTLRWGVAVLDLALFAALWRLAELGRRWWLIDAAALQLLGFLTHLVPLISPHHLLWAQVSARYLIWGLISALFFIGAWEAWALRPRTGPTAARP